MKNSKFLLLIFILIAVGIVGGCCVLNSVFPKAQPIRLPKTEEVISVQVSDSQQHSVELKNEETELLKSTLAKAVPTRKMSVNDYPAVRPYYKIEAVCLDITYYYFVYTEDNQTYIEVPYEGIYRADSQIYSIITND